MSDQNNQQPITVNVANNKSSFWTIVIGFFSVIAAGIAGFLFFTRRNTTKEASDAINAFTIEQNQTQTETIDPAEAKKISSVLDDIHDTISKN